MAIPDTKAPKGLPEGHDRYEWFERRYPTNKWVAIVKAGGCNITKREWGRLSRLIEAVAIQQLMVFIC